MKILIISLRYLGDTLLIRPALRALRHAHPEARIDALVTGGTGIALDGCHDVDRVIEWPRKGLAGQLACLGKIAVSGYDAVVDFTGNDRSAFVVLLSRARQVMAYRRNAKSRFSLARIVTDRLPENPVPHDHFILQRLKLLEINGIPSQGSHVGLLPEPASTERARELLAGLPSEKILHIHPTSRDMQKALPAAVVREVARAAMQEGWGVVVTGGSAQVERDHVAECVAGLQSEQQETNESLPSTRPEGQQDDRTEGQKPLPLLRTFNDLGWHDFVAVIAECSRYWGSDTAPSHIAAALDRPLRVDFGPSASHNWYPINPAGFGVVHTCHCLGEKNTCPPSISGKCLHNLTATDILEWLHGAPVPTQKMRYV